MICFLRIIQHKRHIYRPLLVTLNLIFCRTKGSMMAQWFGVCFKIWRSSVQTLILERLRIYQNWNNAGSFLCWTCTGLLLFGCYHTQVIWFNNLTMKHGFLFCIFKLFSTKKFKKSYFFDQCLECAAPKTLVEIYNSL